MEFLSLFLEPLEYSLFGWAMFFLLWVIVILFLLLVLAFIDRLSVKTIDKKGIVTSKVFTPKHTTYVFNNATKCLQPIFYDDNWELGIKVGDDFDTISVSESFYNKKMKGDAVNVSCGNGKIFNNFYITSVW